MRTTIELDDKLVADARKALGGPSLRAMIEASLREAIRTHYREALRNALGTFDLDVTDEDLANWRRDRTFE